MNYGLASLSFPDDILCSILHHGGGGGGGMVSGPCATSTIAAVYCIWYLFYAMHVGIGFNHIFHHKNDLIICQFFGNFYFIDLEELVMHHFSSVLISVGVNIT